MTQTDDPVITELASADALADQHRAVEAIDALTAANRAHRDDRIERRLVELRTAAFAELPTTPARPSWPATFPDPFPGAADVPRATRDRLDGDLIGGALTHHGALYVQGLIEPDEAQRIRDRVDAGLDARGGLAEGDPVEDAAPAYVPFERGAHAANVFGAQTFLRTVDSPGALFELADLFERRGITRAVTQYLGERPAMIAHKWVIRRQPTGKRLSDFHQDGAFLGEGIRTVNCWIALSDCGPGTDRPGIEFVPRRLPLLPTGLGSAYDWSITAETVEGAAPGVTLCTPTFAEGDALIFDELLPHRTTRGLHLTTRYAVESWFVAPSSFPDEHVAVVL